MNYIIDPLSLKSTYLFSEQGKNLLKKYINEYNKLGGSKTIKEKCSNPLFDKENRSELTDKIETSCNIENYRKTNILPNSIDYVLGKGLYKREGEDEETFNKRKEGYKTKRGKEAVKLSDAVVTFLKQNYKNLIESDKMITILGPLEIIVGFFIQYLKYFNEKNKNETETEETINVSHMDYKNFIVLSVEPDVWSTDFNRDFIDCSIKLNNTPFDNISTDCPIIALSKDKNILTEIHEDNIDVNNIRVSHCEMYWINELIKNHSMGDNTYEWKTTAEDVDLNGGTLYINLLLKNKN